MDELTADDPRRIGSFRLLGRLGAGGMGRVYLGRTTGGRTVAVKVVHSELARDPEFRSRFAAEVDAAREVGGEWTAQVIEADTTSDELWVASSYIAGPTLDECAPLPDHSLSVLAGGLAKALEAIHGAGLIHRDLKPSNVLLTLDGPRVIDFGIVRALNVAASSARTRTGVVLGTPGFLSPEQIHGERLGPASDIFALGAVLVYAATGREPFHSEENSVPAVIFKAVEGEPDFGEMSGPMRDLAAQCLAKDPDERPTAEQIVAVADFAEPAGGSWLPGKIVNEVGRHAIELLALDSPGETSESLGQQPPPESVAVTPVVTPATPPTPVEQHTQISRPRRRFVLPAVLSGILMVAVAAGLLVWLTARSDRSPPPASNATPVETPQVPVEFVGTWAGTVNNAAGTKSRQKRVTISAGAVGQAEAVIVTSYPDHVCEGHGTVSSVEGESLILSGETVTGACKPAGTQILSLNNDGSVTWTNKKSRGVLARSQ